MLKRHKWNNGICKKTGQPWVFIRYHGFRGPSIRSCDHVYTDGCGNLLYIDTFSKINKDYESRRTPEIITKEKQFELKDREDRNNLTGYYSPSRFNSWWDCKWKKWDIFWESRTKWEWPIRILLLAILLSANFVLRSCKQSREEQRQREQHLYLEAK
jgi:hypothetical protein